MAGPIAPLMSSMMACRAASAGSNGGRVRAIPARMPATHLRRRVRKRERACGGCIVPLLSPNSLASGRSGNQAGCPNVPAPRLVRSRGSASVDADLPKSLLNLLYFQQKVEAKTRAGGPSAIFSADLKSHACVVAGLVPATPDLKPGSKMIEMAGTKPATTETTKSSSVVEIGPVFAFSAEVLGCSGDQLGA